MEKLTEHLKDKLYAELCAVYNLSKSTFSNASVRMFSRAKRFDVSLLITNTGSSTEKGNKSNKDTVLLWSSVVYCDHGIGFIRCIIYG